MQLRLGIDIACRAPHQASLADERGEFIFTGRRFRTSVADLDHLWAMLPDGTESGDVMVIMEPTRNAWVPLAAWFRRRGARVVLVPPERSADLRAYYAKHTKTDRLDSRMLARLPLLHPEGLHEEHGLGPGDLRGDPYVLDAEKRALLMRAYEVFPRGHPKEGRRRFSRVAISLAKGSAKTEWGAAVSAAELSEDAPVRFGGWDAQGNPVGVGVRDPYIPMLAATLEQSDELAFTALYVMLSEGPIADAFDIGLTRIRRKDGSGRAVALAGAPNARDGARTTHQLADEAHGLDLPRLVQAWETMIANAAKRRIANAWSLELGTAFIPGEGSVAERTYGYAQAVLKGEIDDPALFYFARTADPAADLTTPEGVRAAIIEAAGPTAPWRDIDGVAAQFDDPTADRAHLTRVWLNVPHQASHQAFNIQAWDTLARPDHAVPRGAKIAVGFDGSFLHDATALIGVEIESGHVFVIRVWEHPPRTRADWAVDRDDVESVVQATFDTYDVWMMHADPHFWEDHIANWKARYRRGKKDRVEEFDTRSPKSFSYGLRNLSTAIATGSLTHDGSPTLRAHLGNARRVESRLVAAADGQPLWTIRKDRPDSPNKIDAAVATVLAWEARNASTASGAKRKSAYSGRVCRCPRGPQPSHLRSRQYGCPPVEAVA